MIRRHALMAAALTAVLSAPLAIPSPAVAAGLWPGLPVACGVASGTGPGSVANPGTSTGITTTPAGPCPLTGNELIPADTALPQGQNPQTELLPMQAVRGAGGLQQSTPVTAFSIQVLNSTNVLSLTPAGTLATGTILLPLAPQDGQRVRIFDTQIQTALTITPATGQTINGTAITALAANTPIEYIYQASSLTWFRTQ